MTTKKKIFTFVMGILIMLVSVMPKDVNVYASVYGSSADEPSMNIPITKSTGLKIASRETLYYEGYNSSHFILSNGATAFCMEYDYIYAPEGQTIKEAVPYSSDPNSIPYRLLYYGWGGPEQWAGFGGDINVGVTATALVLSYVTTGSPDYVFKNSTYQQFYDYVQSAPIPPSGDISFSPSSATVSVVDGIQKTSTITFQADSRLSVTISLDEDITLYFEGNDTPYKENVKIKGGDKFYLVAPLERKTSFEPTVTYSGDKLFTVMQAIPLYVETGYQKMAYRANKSVSTSLNAQFKEFKGKIKIIKESSNKVVTDNNECYDLTGTVFGIFKNKQDAENATINNENSVGTIAIDETGVGYSPELPYGTYYIKETKVGRNYIPDDTVYEITVPSEHSIVNEPVTDNISVLINKVDEDGVGLADGEFLVKYYDLQQERENPVDPATLGMTAKRIWYLKSDKEGKVCLEDAYKIGGDELYYNSNGDSVLPLGTITIQETKAPEGYIPDEKVFVQSVEENQKSVDGHFYNCSIISNKSIIPSLETQARDSSTNNNTAKVSNQTTLIDNICYEDVLVDKEYKIKAVLVNKATKEPVLVEGEELRKEVVFIPEESEGSIEVDITFDSGEMSDQEVVFLEELYRGEKLVATHADINNKKQTISFEPLKGQIKIHKYGERRLLDESTGTYTVEKIDLEGIEFGIYAAEDIVDKDNNIIFAKDVLVETIVTNKFGAAESSYNLPLGNYRIHEENTPEEYITSEDTYVELSENCSKELISDLNGQVYIVSESISINNKLKPEEPPVATEEPPVVTKEPPALPPDTPITGDKTNIFFVACIMVVSILGMVVYFIKLKKKR